MCFRSFYYRIRRVFSPLKQKAIQKLLVFFEEQYGLLPVQNRNVREKALEVDFYNKMYAQYHEMIEQGVKETGEQQQNDTIWVCWLQGEESAPKLVKSCINSLRKNMSEKKIVILTEDSIPQYIDFPNYILEKRKAGLISNAHFSDLVRIELLCKYGGIWCDATLLCTSTPPAFMTDSPLFVFKEMDLQRRDNMPTICSNWYIAAMSNQKILLLTRNLLYEYWKTANDIGNYFCFHIFMAMAVRRYPEEWKAIPVYNNHSPHTLQFELADPYSEERWKQITAMSPLHKLNHHNDYTKYPDSFYYRVLGEYLS